MIWLPERESKWRCMLVGSDFATRRPHVTYTQPRLRVLLAFKEVMPGLFLHDRCRSCDETSFEEREKKIDLYRVLAWAGQGWGSSGQISKKNSYVRCVSKMIRSYAESR